MSDTSTGVIPAIRSGIDILNTILLEGAILGMLGVWTVIWYYLAKTTAAAEGLVDGVILSVYTLLPVLGILLWRLSVRTGFEMPGVTDVIGSPEYTNTVDEPSTSQVAKRFETGE